MISKNQIKYIQQLHSKKNREDQFLFIIEGVKLVNEFLASKKYEIKEVFATASYLENHKPDFLPSSIKITEITNEDLNKISLQQTPNQVLALVYQTTLNLDTTLLNAETTLYLDDIRDPGNLGTIIRIADWFGIKQVICSPNTTEVYNPKTLQASMGAVLRVNVIYKPFEELLLKAQNTPIYGAILSGENIYSSKLKNGILIIGNEANGISADILKCLTHKITIPAAVHNGSESLNAANACAIICAEFYRQLNY